jgi:hypothetical protein
MNHKVIDNFLEEEYFNSLVALLEEIPWYYLSTVAASRITENNIFYLYHLLYTDNKPTSPHYDKLLPVVRKLGGESLIRIKGNLYPNTETLHEHPMHTDFPFSHTSAILYLNTCDGYTKLVDGTKIDSIANRVLVFDSGEEHCSTTTTNAPTRFNINFNYLQPETPERMFKEEQHPELREFRT